MIDFSKIGTGNTAETVLPPREIFNALPKKNAVKFQYPRDVQSQVWEKWHGRRDENSLVIKMNTGSGKTVVGLLILKSCLNEGKSPAVYVCPDNYLVKQVIDAANELGVEITDDPQSPRFLSGKSILVINIFKLVNGKSIFGVGDEGSKLKISSLIIDDAHACLDTIEDQFTINIPSDRPIFTQLYQIFRNSLHEQCESKALEIENGDPTSYMQVPYWVWQEKISEISKILIKNSSEDSLKFTWPLVKENPKLSHCVVSSSGIEISPHSIPIHMIPSIVDADRKIFMTATLVDNSILSSHFAVPENQIDKPIVPDSAGDVGDRMILLPQVINTETTDEDIKKYANHASQNMNVVVIVPSQYRANYWSDISNLTLTASNLYDGVEKLKSAHIGLVVLVNRYDGVDLPGDACRLLIIDGFPDVRKKIDKIKQGILMGSTRQSSQIVQRIEQGMGRGIRSNDDFCVVFLVGRDLTKQLYTQGAIERLSPATKAQLKLSEQISEQIQGKPIHDITDTINYCLSRNEKWVAASKGALASLKYSEENTLDEVIISFRKAYDSASNNNPNLAAKALETQVNKIKNEKEKGYIKQIFAEYTNLYDIVEAQKIQMSAVANNRRILKPISGIQYHKISGNTLDQASTCSNYLKNNHSDPNNLIITLNGLIEDLQFKENSSNIFEEAMKQIAPYLGFGSQRPEQEYKKGPDILWSIGDLKYFVIEAKNEAKTLFISKDYCNQLNGSCNWFEEKYDSTCSYTPILIHPYNTFEYAASPKQSTRIMTIEKLDEFCKSTLSFIKSISSNNELGDQAAIREKLIAHKLRATDFESTYTVKYTSKKK
ncbi:DEAD/DEAH box helicase family protein [Simiduia litorea]|uniref:DEAD/DEAH box helicase family protein n=1 Tax=Simiduia litorea TaxID=1435348 RepID=UPI0036F3734D